MDSNEQSAPERTDESEPVDELPAWEVGAVGALAFGSVALDDETVETDEESAAIDTTEPAPDEDERSQSDGLVLVPLIDYHPGLTVRVVDRLPAPTVVRLLRLPNDETVPVLTRPDEYAGYVVRSENGDERVYSTTFVFTRDALEIDARYEFGADAQVFSTQLNLFRATAHCVDSPDEENDTDG